MPELPEVECLSRAVNRQVSGQELRRVTFLRPDLRTPIPIHAIETSITGQPILGVNRRSKYMLWTFEKAELAIHLGMSGNVLAFDSPDVQKPHTHAIFEFALGQNRSYLHFIDPRRFGMIELIHGPRSEHRLFKHLGPEPLDHPDLGSHLFEKSRRRRIPIKCLIMDAKIVVGVGNIYASEALHTAKIHPMKPAAKLRRAECEVLAKTIQDTLKMAIDHGGTRFRDFCHPDEHSYGHENALRVYDQKECGTCGHSVHQVRLGGRSTFFCPSCQPGRYHL
jgi:formamidopyrimidine-DNA glycosylase